MVFHHIPPQSQHAQAAPRVGILLVNLGTPDDTGYRAVRRYLSEFLSDRRVIEGPPALWQPILQGVVLTTRPRRSGKAYARIWNTHKDESPLRTYTRHQAEALSERFAAQNVPVAWGMRYGTPTIAEAVHELLEKGCDRILCMPLYPQYSATTTATANDQLFRALMRLRNQPAIRTLPSFPDHPAFIKAIADSVRLAEAEADIPFQMVVASFHGLPEEYVRKGDSYRAECERTVVALRKALGRDETTLPMTFQSRFGPTKWLEPYTAPFIAGLPEKGITSIAVVTPCFMADCLETLDEIGNEVSEEFIQAGGQEFTQVPCLNDTPASIDLLEALAHQELAGWL
ncbi:ferrochelatase [Acetobacter ascendens]|uniref:ferrochelatase n=1 Tax=Acetobacter ascendens TaxID=481146 RepID=UPI000875B4AC|nr:ferrochelatase [Acetobacter ascendens]AOW48804.1 ferrochelatase [Acetobacter ascendens]